MAETRIAVIDEVYANLKRLEGEFALALPSNVPPEKFIRVVRTALQNNPSLLDLDRTSLYSSCMKCAQDGLMPDGREAALVPFKGKVAYMPMVAGFCKRARNSGEIATIDAFVVYAKDTYDAWVDEKGPHFTFRKAKGERGEPVMTVGYAITKDAGLFIEEIDESQMNAIEKSSRAAEGPWKGPFRDEMKRKSALRRLSKYRLPSSSDLDGVIASEDAVSGIEPEVVTPATDKPNRTGAIIEAQAIKESEPEPVVEPKSNAAKSTQGKPSEVPI